VKSFYLVCAIVGGVVPFTQFAPWIAEHGLDVPLLFAELFSTRIGAFFGLDVLLSAVVLIVFIVSDKAKSDAKEMWIPIAATCLIGVSCGLPLFLWMRERRVAAGHVAQV